MSAYIHTVQYYETDKMGITHHSNYIRWMEEARISYLSENGWSYDRLEKEGILSPVIGVSAEYLKTTTFPDSISIMVTVKKYSGARLTLGYDMTTPEGTPVFRGESSHCFISPDGRLLRLKKASPALDEWLSEQAEKSGGK